MTNAAEVFIELAYTLVKPEFCAELLSATGKADSFEIYNHIFEFGKRYDTELKGYEGYRNLSVLISLCDDRSTGVIKTLLCNTNSNDQRNVIWALAFKDMKNPHNMKSLSGILIEFIKYKIILCRYREAENLLPDEKQDLERDVIVTLIYKIGGQRECIKALTEYLHDENQRVRDFVAECFLRFDTPEALKLLTELVKGYKGNELYNEAMLIKIGAKSRKSVVESLRRGETITLLHNTDQAEMQAVIELLKQVLVADQKKYALIDRTMSTLEWELEEIRDTKLPQLLIEFLSDDGFANYAKEQKDNFAYKHLVSLIIKTQATGYFITLLKNENKEIRDAISRRSSKFRNPQAIKLLLELFKHCDATLTNGVSGTAEIENAVWVQNEIKNALGGISKKYYYEVENALLNAYYANQLNIDKLINLACHIISIYGDDHIRNAAARSRYLFPPNSLPDNIIKDRYDDYYYPFTLFSYIPFLTSDDMDKISCCCSTELKIGDEAIVRQDKNKEIHSLNCPLIDAAYWS